MLLLFQKTKSLAICFVLLFFSPTVGEAKVVERVLAVVNDEVIFFTDLSHDRAFSLNSLLLPPLTKLSPLDGRYPGMQALINKKLIISEANRLNISGPSQSSVDVQYKMMVDRFGGLKALATTMARYGLDHNDLLEIVTANLLIKNFLEMRIFPFIRDFPVDDGFASHGSRRGDDQIWRARAIKRLEIYLARLKSRAMIEINPFPHN